MRNRFAPLGLLAAAALSGCDDKKPTAIVVSFASEARPSGEVDALQVVVRRGGAVPFDTTYDLPRDAPLPGTLTLDNGDGDPSEPVTVEVVASKAGKSRILRRAKLAFTDQKQKLLRMPLRYSCADFPETCGPEQTCAGYQCVPVDGEVARVRDAAAPIEGPGLRAQAVGDSCFDAAACAADAKPTKVAADCTLDTELASGTYNVFMRWKIAPDNPVALDPGDALEGFVVDGGKVKLAPGLCRALSAPPTATNGALEVSVSTSCPPKPADAEPCTKLSDGAGGRAGASGAGAGGAGAGGKASAGAGGKASAGSGGAAGKASAGSGGAAGKASAGSAGFGGGLGGAAGAAGFAGGAAGAAGAAGKASAGSAGSAGFAGGAAGAAGKASAGSAGSAGFAGGAAGSAGFAGGAAGSAGFAGAGGAASCVDGESVCKGNEARLCSGGVLMAPVTCQFGCTAPMGCHQCESPADCGSPPDCFDSVCNANKCALIPLDDGTPCGGAAPKVCQLGSCNDKCVGTGPACLGRSPATCNQGSGLLEPIGGPCDFTCSAGNCASVVSLALGSDHTCAATDMGEVLCWGRNHVGQLGLGLEDGFGHEQPEPLSAFGSSVFGSGNHTCAFGGSGDSLNCWGDDSQGQLGRGPAWGGFVAEPTPAGWQSTAPSTLDSVATGAGFTLIVASGLMYGVGDNSFLQYGVAAPSNVVLSMVGMPAPTLLRAGRQHACAIDAAGSLQCWGANSRGQVLVPASSAEALGSMTQGPFSSHAAGGDNTCFVKQNSLFCAGDNTFGQLAMQPDGDPHDQPVLVSPPGTAMWGDVVVGDGFVCATYGSDVYCWGKNDVGQCGSDTGGAPAPVTKVPTVKAPFVLIAGREHACTLDENHITCWGGAAWGKLGRPGLSSAPGFVVFAP